MFISPRNGIQIMYCAWECWIWTRGESLYRTYGKATEFCTPIVNLFKHISFLLFYYTNFTVREMFRMDYLFLWVSYLLVYLFELIFRNEESWFINPMASTAGHKEKHFNKLRSRLRRFRRYGFSLNCFPFRSYEECCISSTMRVDPSLSCHEIDENSTMSLDNISFTISCQRCRT